MKDLVRTGLVQAMIRPIIGPLIGGMDGGGGPVTSPQGPMSWLFNEGAFGDLVHGGDDLAYVDSSGDPVFKRTSTEPTVYAHMEGDNHTSIGSSKYYYEFYIAALPVGTNVGFGTTALNNRQSSTDIRSDYFNGWYADGTKINNPNYSSKGSTTTWAGTFEVGDRIGIAIDQSLDDVILYQNGVEIERIELTNTGTNNYLICRMIGDGVIINSTDQAYLPDGFLEY